MKKNILLTVVILSEIVFCFAICMRINMTRYNSWTESNAFVKEIADYGNAHHTARSKQKKYYTIYIDYLGESNLIRFADYYPDFTENDEIIVKCNPDDLKEVVYIPYEEYCVTQKRRNTIIVFAGLIGITLLIHFIRINHKNMDNIISKIESDYD
ncbi:MAG: hypothetical protein Q4D76_19295 [Oscillospiraceae bacterium]|nr:hypothetical protein [Oscillospiraceae bacterium]